MKNSFKNEILHSLICLCKILLYSIFFIAIIYTVFIISSQYPILFERLLKLWPIGILILSVILQYLYFETNFGLFLLLAGFLFTIGTMLNINLHNNFYTSKLKLPIILLALAVSILNYYIFKKRNVFYLPFILILIIISILLLILPILSSISGFNFM